MIPLLALAIALGAGPAGCAEPSPETAPLDAWCTTLAARPRLPFPSAEDRRTLRAVYERPELRRARADTAGFRRMLAGLWARVLELLGSAEAERYAAVGRVTFVAAGLTALVAALAALRRRRATAGAVRTREEASTGRPLTPDRSAALADAALARGDLPEAVRLAFLSALAALEAAGRLPRDRTLTNTELSARLAGAGAGVADEFGALGRTFDGAIYGGRRVDAPLVRESLARARRIRAASSPGGAP